MALERLEATPLEVEGEGDLVLAGEEVGEGPPVVLLHGVTATRRYVVHGSLALPRRGYRLVTYDARGHGESTPAPPGSGYGYQHLAGDLGRVVERTSPSPPLVGGHSMGCHTVATYALEHVDQVAAVVLIAPATLGLPPDAQSLAGWDRLADGLERDGVEGFMRAYEADLDVDPEWRERVLRITRERLQRHRHPQAVAEALREVPRSIPFDGLAELESLDVPALVVASRDEADPGHPRGVAEAWAEALPRAELIGEDPGESPLAWQGGRLSRVIADFCESPAVAERLRA
ncbi:MAG TPA: alpha/beta hydrolase [Solirubrobacterales bacterium]|jgi:3-oxoadipate enol-lactonase|nr:alpha/beta hydrolase [Solirubrobacterales bacterium]